LALIGICLTAGWLPQAPAQLPSGASPLTPAEADLPNNDYATQVLRGGWELPDWVVRNGAMFLKRYNPNCNPLVSDPGTGDPLLDLGDQDFGWGSGIELSGLRAINATDQIEARFFGVWDWEAAQSLLAMGPVSLDLAVPNVTPAGGTLATDYDSRLFSTELNFRRRWAPGFSWLAGVRWLELRDDFDLLVSMPSLQAATLLGARTRNDLIGAQLGVDGTFWDFGGPLRIEGLLKWGVYGNVASVQGSLVTDDGLNPVVTQSIDQRHSDAAYVGEIGLTALYRCTSWLSLRVSGTTLWVDEVALASDQLPLLNFPAQTGSDSGGHAFYHGLTVGLELRR
jgi:hypothetical protein